MKKSILSLITFLAVILSLAAGCGNSAPENISNGTDYSDPDNWLVFPESVTHVADVFYERGDGYIDGL
jgi:hypothetical protein